MAEHNKRRSNLKQLVAHVAGLARNRKISNAKNKSAFLIGPEYESWRHRKCLAKLSAYLHASNRDRVTLNSDANSLWKFTIRMLCYCNKIHDIIRKSNTFIRNTDYSLALTLYLGASIAISLCIAGLNVYNFMATSMSTMTTPGTIKMVQSARIILIYANILCHPSENAHAERCRFADDSVLRRLVKHK